MTIEQVTHRLQGVQGGGGQYKARCPAHDDKNASLSVSEGDKGGIVLHCHAGCPTERVVEALGLTIQDVMPEKRPQRSPVVATYQYTDIGGKPIGKKFRREDKSFYWQRLNSEYKKPQGPILYNAPALFQNPVYIVEGEKDVETMKRLSQSAVSAPDGAGGASKWPSGMNQHFTGKDVIIIPDNDEVGRAFAAEIARQLHPIAESIKVYDLRKVWPEIPEHGDISDLAATFGKAEEMDGMQDKLDEMEKMAGEYSAEDEFSHLSHFSQAGVENEFAIFEPLEAEDNAPLLDFPVVCLPVHLREYVTALSTELQVSPDMPAVIGLGIAALCVQGKFIINPKAGWVEPLNLYTAVIAKPSERKSPVVRAMLAPVYDYQGEENERRAPDIAEYQMQRKIFQKRFDNLSDAAARPKPKATMSEVSQARLELGELEDVKPLRLVADDITPEALASLMVDNHGKIAVASTEGGVFDMIAGRYENAANMDVYLKAYSGDPMHIDRKGRPSEHLEHPALTMVLTIQPSVLSEIMQNDRFSGRGLLARFLYLFPSSTIGDRDYDTEPVNEFVREAYNAALYQLLKLGEATQVLTLSSEAAQLAKDYFYEVEKELTDALEDIEEWAGKLHGQSMRIAGVLHCFSNGAESARVPIDGETMAAAIQIGHYFADHAKTAFRKMGLSEPQEVKDAKYIWRRILSTGQDELSKRDALRLCQRFKAAEDMEQGLSKLISNGYICLTKMTLMTKRGRPSETIYINPLARKEVTL